MRTLLHLSDLHFGRTDADLLKPLEEAVTQISPHLIIVSGDLTQRARPPEFQAARRFLDALPFPKLIVPGNHDIPVHPLRRFLRPFARYQAYIQPDLEPMHRDDGMFVLGINSANPLTIKEGSIHRAQLSRVRRTFSALAPGVIRIVACHHPFDLPQACGRERVIANARDAIATLAACGTDLVLSGHFHVSHSTCSTRRYAAAGHSMLLVTAGTAMSTRLRGQPNAFNVIRIDPRQIEVTPRAWSSRENSFVPLEPRTYERGPSGWTQQVKVVS